MGLPGSRRYISVLLRPEGVLGQGEAGGYFGLELFSGSTPLFIGKPSANVYVLENVGGTGQHSSGVVPLIGESVLLVVRADFALGVDSFRLYVNPTPGAVEPSFAQAVKADSDVGLVGNIAFFSTGAFSADEIRIGQTFADVTIVPEPSALVLLSTGALLVLLRRTKSE